MITPIVEKLLLTGRAQKKSKVHGISAVGLIRCPKDRLIIVTDFTYFLFQDSDGGAGERLFYQMNLKSSENEQNYVFRNYFITEVGPVAPFNPAVRMDVFDIFKSDVHITITRCSDYSGKIDSSFTALKPQAQQQLPPNGYGISTPVVRRVTLAESTDIMPSGIPENYDLPPTGRTREDFGTDTVVGQTALLEPTSNYHYPCINFTVIEVNSKAMENIQ